MSLKDGFASHRHCGTHKEHAAKYERSSMEAALAFLATFPEVKSWHITVLTEDKRALINKTAASVEEVRKQLPSWMGLNRTHFFARPNLATGLFLDLDSFQGSWADLWALQPRLVSETLPGHYQAWFVLPDSQPEHMAVWATKQLSAALGGDVPRSYTAGQDAGQLEC